MKKTAAVVALAALIAVSLTACGTSSGSSGNASSESDAGATSVEQVTINTSPDKYTWYIKSYVGMNASAVGYTSMSGQRRDEYGGGTIQIVFVAPDGTFIDPSDKETLKDYYVVAQNTPPNTELKYEFEKNSDGKEYDNLTSWQSVDQVVLSVNKVGDKSGDTVDMTEIQASPDHYTFYVRDYVGRNLAECGYVAMSGKLTDEYGHAAHIHFDITGDDGSYIELPDDDASSSTSSEGSDEESAAVNMMSEYVVVSQSVAPNTQGMYTLHTKSNGEEYTNLVDTQSIESIALTVKKIG